MTTTGVPSLVTAGLLWGTGGVLGTAFGDAADLPPTAVAACRLGGGGLLLVAYAIAGGTGRPTGLPALRRIVVIGLLAAVFQGAYFVATSLLGVAAATLVAIGSAPVVCVAVESFGARRRPDPIAVRTVAVGIVGLVFLVGAPTGVAAGTALLGSMTALLSGSSFAAITLVGRRPVDGLSESAMTGWSFLLGGALLVAGPTVAGDLPAPTVTASSIVLLVALAVMPTAAAYTFWFRGLRTSPASTAAVIGLLEPLTGTVLAMIVLGERLTMLGLIGAALLLVAVVDTSRPRAVRA
ncbi:DMT family transporter [Rhodococcoides corynebacterioides]|uniref:DMT family transporter n=1 Tax=Rhodococcoides corynebacterioides TaxID=53972 RepID=UPI003F80ED5B